MSYGEFSPLYAKNTIPEARSFVEKVFDGNAAELLSAAITTNILLICKQIPSLVACSAGMSRSPMIVAASLALVRGQSPDAVLRELIDGYPHDVSPPLWVDVKNAYDELLD